MTFIETVPEGEATGALAEMYETDRQAFGHLPNFTQAFSHRPDVYAAWRQLNGAIKANMDLRRYELATVAAARRLRSSYCALAHGSVLARQVRRARRAARPSSPTTTPPASTPSTSPSWTSPTRSPTTPRR